MLKPERETNNYWRSSVVLATFVLTAFLTVLIGSGAATARPDSDAVVRCDPEVVAANVGETVSFTIYVQDVIDMNAADVQLAFDPAIAQVVDADPTKGGTQIEILEEFLAADFVVRDQADNVAGTIRYANTQVNPSQPVSGSGPLARVTMQSLGAGSFDMPITYKKIVLGSGQEIPSTARDCRVAFFDPNAISQTFLPIGIAP